MIATFSSTSDEPYDRHQYKLITQNRSSIIFDNYEDLMSHWFQNARNWNGCVVEVLDRKQKKNTSSGFGK